MIPVPPNTQPNFPLDREPDVVFYEYYTGVQVPVDGTFLQFGVAHGEYGSAESSAIILLKDGTLRNVLLHDVMFKQPGSEK